MIATDTSAVRRVLWCSLVHTPAISAQHARMIKGMQKSLHHPASLHRRLKVQLGVGKTAFEKTGLALSPVLHGSRSSNTRARDPMFHMKRRDADV